MRCVCPFCVLEEGLLVFIIRFIVCSKCSYFVAKVLFLLYETILEYNYCAVSGGNVRVVP